MSVEAASEIPCFSYLYAGQPVRPGKTLCEAKIFFETVSDLQKYPQ